jgi:hypothetical protein
MFIRWGEGFLGKPHQPMAVAVGWSLLASCARVHKGLTRPTRWFVEFCRQVARAEM